MLCPRLFKAVLLATAAYLLLCSSANALSLPEAIMHAVTGDSGEMEDTCQCDCCYNVGQQGRTECVPPSDTTFDTPLCSSCNVEACAKAFRVTCGQESSVVSTACIKRKGWMLSLVPAFFIVASISLLLYGLFFKTFDGYHDNSRPPPTITEVLPVSKPPSFGTFPNNYGIAPEGDRHNLIAKATSKLPPISELAEVALEEDAAVKAAADVETGAVSSMADQDAAEDKA